MIRQTQHFSRADFNVTRGAQWEVAARGSLFRSPVRGLFGRILIGERGEVMNKPAVDGARLAAMSLYRSPEMRPASSMMKKTVHQDCRVPRHLGAPFWGSIGVAPPSMIRRLSSGPPGAHAGNLDNEELGAGSWRIYRSMFRVV